MTRLLAVFAEQLIKVLGPDKSSGRASAERTIVLEQVTGEDVVPRLLADFAHGLGGRGSRCTAGRQSSHVRRHRLLGGRRFVPTLELGLEPLDFALQVIFAIDL